MSPARRVTTKRPRVLKTGPVPWAELANNATKVAEEIMTMAKRHHVRFIAEKTVKEPTKVRFETKSGDHVDFVAKKPVREEVEVSFMARNKKNK